MQFFFNIKLFQYVAIDFINTKNPLTQILTLKNFNFMRFSHSADSWDINLEYSQYKENINLLLFCCI